MKILVRATNWVGDAVMSLPAIRALRDNFPGAHLAVVARPWVADLYAREAAIDRVIEYRPRGGFRAFAAKRAFARSLRDERFDCAVLLQ
ncbi:MAG: glycosyltransferase family 9 protein, partial [Bryobacteraceae bacterium]